MEIVLGAAIAGGIVAAIANARGRAPAGWFVYGFLLAPVAFVHALFLPRLYRCETCAERVRPAARVCPHCGTRQPPRIDHVATG